ncbi:MAG: heme-binding domain-containing protein [Bacteroidia bacterium]|nr:heme-binding domain-containing protein [Bacteroidia bacterium]
MRKQLTVKKISIALLILFLVIQLFRIDKQNPPVVAEKDFLALNTASAEVQNIIKASCYDCHSNTSVYPWYTNVAPVSWWIKHHIKEGRKHLNFSEWGNYTAKKADHKLEECVEMIQEGEMPMSSYTLIHRETKLSEEESLMLVNWFSSLRKPEVEKSDDQD